jgi:hypothetical protein
MQDTGVGSYLTRSYAVSQAQVMVIREHPTIMVIREHST